MGMLATVINSLGLSSALVVAGVKARVLTAIRMEPIGEFYTKWKAIEAMENGEVVIMSAGAKTHSSQPIQVLHCVVSKLKLMLC